MKKSELKQLIKEEIEKVLKEASPNELKNLDFNKLQKIFNFITKPQKDLWDPIKVKKGGDDMSEYKSISGYDPGEFNSVVIYLKKLAEAYAGGEENFDNFIFKYKNQIPSSVTEIDKLPSYLKDKNLGAQIKNLNTIFQKMDYFMYENSPKYFIQSYNKLVDWVNNFSI
jgi:hypothetical protein